MVEGGKRPLVLFGAGQMGRAVHRALIGKPITAIAFSDNNPDRWGLTIGGVPVLSPKGAAEAYGRGAVFVITFQADAEDLAIQEAFLRGLGVKRVCPFTDLLRRWPETCGWHPGTPAYYAHHKEQIESALHLFSDEISQQQFLGHLRWRLLRDLEALPECSPRDQYFCNELIHLREDECFVDGGAFDGDTLRAFLRERGDAFGRVHAFEPDPGSFAALQSFVEGLPPGINKRIHTFSAALDAEVGTVHIEAQGDHLSSLGTHGLAVPALSVDGLPQDLPVSFIKLDLEGAERGALEGCRETLRRHRPLVAMAVYHHPGDLFKLPLFLAGMCRDYRFHLRTHNRFGLDAVFYAVPEERSR
jgi:FkbM family methyltransferase